MWNLIILNPVYFSLSIEAGIDKFDEEKILDYGSNPAGDTSNLS